MKQQIEAPRAVTTNQRMSPIGNAIDTWMVGSANATGVKFDICLFFHHRLHPRG